ncbi:hypothetical protein [Peribacillus asahii]|uniref:Oxidoreductase n=1 Tax=Peribacillus asahii TaxID=228899 RepID=A0A3Q9RNQ3_9BACI|nr:hypothetical protein [Peribacillus asahii]AZV43290.1 oxidoreductase [Peribacillus asahii]USK83354.1 hypothetical protein LIT35_12765 [Peribacillus asahii]
MVNIAEKVIFIMGGTSSGIGEETTKKLAQERAKLIIVARCEDCLKNLFLFVVNTKR